jgi:hypothetical protein
MQGWDLLGGTVVVYRVRDFLRRKEGRRTEVVCSRVQQLLLLMLLLGILLEFNGTWAGREVVNAR